MTTSNVKSPSLCAYGARDASPLASWCRSFAHYLTRSSQDGSKTGRPGLDKALDAYLMVDFIDLGPAVDELHECDWVALFAGVDGAPPGWLLVNLVCALHEPGQGGEGGRRLAVTAAHDTKLSQVSLGILLALCAAFRKHATDQGWAFTQDWVWQFLEVLLTDPKHLGHQLSMETLTQLHADCQTTA